MSALPEFYPSIFPAIPPWAIRATHGLVIEDALPQDYEARLHSIRLLLACNITSLPCYEDQPAEYVAKLIAEHQRFERQHFESARNFSRYRDKMRVKEATILYHDAIGFDCHYYKIAFPSLRCLSFVAVWSDLTTEQQIRIALSPAFSLDPVRCLLALK